MGFLLRMSNRNGLHGFYWLFHLLGREKLNRLKIVDIPALSQLFGSTTDKLLRVMPRRRIHEGIYSYEIHGHSMSKSYLLRPLKPQLCPICIAEKGLSLALWDLSLVCVCPEHFCMLIEKCPLCSKQIQWNRPLLGFCNCGAKWLDYFSDDSLQRDHPGFLYADISASILDKNRLQKIATSRFDRVLASLTLDTFSRLIWIFGIKRKSDDPVRTGTSKKILSPIEAAEICERGYTRLRFALLEKGISSISETVHLPSLKILIAEIETRPDVVFLEQVIFSLGVSDLRLIQKSYQPFRQLNLF